MTWGGHGTVQTIGHPYRPGGDYRNRAEFRTSSPQLLFTSDHLNGIYAVSADGQRFLMLKPVASDSREQVAIATNAVLVENFDEELKRLVPADPQ